MDTPTVSCLPGAILPSMMATDSPFGTTRLKKLFFFVYCFFGHGILATCALLSHIYVCMCVYMHACIIAHQCQQQFLDSEGA